MKVKELITNDLQADGQFCTLGAIAHAENIDVSDIRFDGDYDDDDCGALSFRLGIADALVREIMWENDSCYTGRPFGFIGPDLNPDAKRWALVRTWVACKVIE